MGLHGKKAAIAGGLAFDHFYGPVGAAELIRVLNCI